MRTITAWLIIVGTFLPVIAAAAAVLLAARLRDSGRQLVLWLVPGVAGAIMFVVARPVMQDGNLLAAVLYTLYWVALAAYYPALLIVAAVRSVRRRR